MSLNELHAFDEKKFVVSFRKKKFEKKEVK